MRTIMSVANAPVPYRILVAVDGSVHANRAAEYAVRYAAGFERCEVILVHAQPAEGYPTAASDEAQFLVEPLDLAAKATGTARSLLDAAKLSYRLKTELTDPASAIESVAHSEGADEIIMGSRGLGQWEGLIMGWVAYRVVHRASIPVTVVRSHSARATATKPDVHRFLVGVDGSAAALKAVEYICRLRAARVPVEAELLNVTAPLPENYTDGALTREVADGYYDKRAGAALRTATEAFRAAAVPCTTHVALGRAADQIVNLGRKLECGRIVMGARGDGSVASLLMGSTAYQVVHLAASPVTLVR
jgi:nucleotide-binding universal stress UspA family protein